MADLMQRLFGWPDITPEMRKNFLREQAQGLTEGGGILGSGVLDLSRMTGKAGTILSMIRNAGGRYESFLPSAQGLKIVVAHPNPGIAARAFTPAEIFAGEVDKWIMQVGGQPERKLLQYLGLDKAVK